MKSTRVPLLLSPIPPEVWVTKRVSLPPKSPMRASSGSNSFLFWSGYKSSMSWVGEQWLGKVCPFTSVWMGQFLFTSRGPYAALVRQSKRIPRFPNVFLCFPMIRFPRFTPDRPNARVSQALILLLFTRDEAHNLSFIQAGAGKTCVWSLLICMQLVRLVGPP